MKKFISVFIGLALLLLCMSPIYFLVVKQDEQRNTPAPKSKVLTVEDRISGALTKRITSTYGVSKVRITENILRNGSAFLTFTFYNDNELMEGVACWGGNRLKALNVTPVHTNVPFTHHALGSRLDDGRKIRLIAGYLNDPAIREIRVAYKDKSTTVFRIKSGQKSYLEYNLGIVSPLDSITGLDENHRVIYKYSWK